MNSKFTPVTRMIVTTSWDDGHPLDLRLAELLAKHGLPATFYVPLSNQRPSMSPAEIRSLASQFEIGGHTLTHCDLNRLSLTASQSEITGCRSEIEQITGRPCRSFCFPMGRFRRVHLAQVRRAGFSIARTVETMSLGWPRSVDGLLLLPTSVQAYATSWAARLRNGVKRLRADNLLRAVLFHRSDWEATAELLLEQIEHQGGVFHLWGHSWEIEESQDWDRLELLMSKLGQMRDRANYATNAEVAGSCP